MFIKNTNYVHKNVAWVTNEQGCMLVTSHKKDKNGYIHVSRSENGVRKDWQLHRLVYTQHHGDIPRGMVVMHSCDEPSCINPDHLSLGTHKDNVHDMISKGRANYIGSSIRGNESKIAQLRMSMYMSQMELAKQVGVNQSTIVRIEEDSNFKTRRKLKTLEKIANVLGVSINDLI